MRCLSPRPVGFLADGKTISWKPNHFSNEYAGFKLPCGKCIECRLEYARQWAVRCVHEAQIHPENVFLTLTYNEENLPKKLEYKHFQDFMKRLRKAYGDNINYFVTGEYGEKTKRPHWHAIIFNWSPKDLQYFRSNERGDKIYKSANLDKLWQKGHTEVGSVTFESAGYVARYASKKLVHGNDKDHDFHPISKKSTRPAIGKRFLEKYYKDIFNYGKLILENGSHTSIPRYYEKWLQKHDPVLWETYVTKIKADKSLKAGERSKKELEQTIKINDKRGLKGGQITKEQHRKKVIDKMFKQLQSYLKGDI